MRPRCGTGDPPGPAAGRRRRWRQLPPEPPVSAGPGRRRLAGTRTLAVRLLPVLLARLALGLVPVLGFVVAGHLLAISVLGGEQLAQLAVLAVIDAYALCAAILGAPRRLILIPPAARPAAVRRA